MTSWRSAADVRDKPVIYPVSTIPSAYRPYILANPMTPISETCRYAFTWSGPVTKLSHRLHSAVASGFSMIAMVISQPVEKNFMHTV